VPVTGEKGSSHRDPSEPLAKIAAMTNPAELTVVDVDELAVPAPAPGLGAAAERFARTMLRKSAQTQRTYRSVYERYGAWLAEYTGAPSPAPSAFTADALAAYLDELDQDKAPATVKKERAALNRLAKYLHTIGAIDATEILMVETATIRDEPRARDALDEATWRRVEATARARLARGAHQRTSRTAAARDLALILVLGDMGLRSEEARRLRCEDVKAKRVDGTRPWLRVLGKGSKVRELPMPTSVAGALLGWERSRPRELYDDPLLFPRLGRGRRDGSFPDAGGQLSGQALSEIVKPLMLAAGVGPELAHPHVLRHTYGSRYMRAGGELSELQRLMGHASPETTSVYVHHTHAGLEAAVAAYEAGPGVLEEHAERRRRRRRA
jgi:integrase